MEYANAVRENAEIQGVGHGTGDSGGKYERAHSFLGKETNDAVRVNKKCKISVIFFVINCGAAIDEPKGLD